MFACVCCCAHRLCGCGLTLDKAFHEIGVPHKLVILVLPGGFRNSNYKVPLDLWSLRHGLSRMLMPAQFALQTPLNRGLRHITFV